MQCSRMVVLRLFTLPPLAVSPWPCCPQPGTAQTARPVRCRQAVLVLRGQHEAAHACVLRTPVAPHSEISSMHCSALRPPGPLFPVRHVLQGPVSPAARVLLRGSRNRPREKAALPRLYGEISPCPLFILRAIPVRMRVWQLFFVKKITNKSSHLYRISRPRAADRANFRILLIPAAPPYA